MSRRRSTSKPPQIKDSIVNGTLRGFRMEVDSCREVLLEGSCALKEYEDEKIVICCAKTDITFSGIDLSIDDLSNDQLRISGRLSGISFH